VLSVNQIQCYGIISEGQNVQMLCGSNRVMGIKLSEQIIMCVVSVCV